MGKKVIQLADKQTDNRLWTVEQMLEDALKGARNSDYKHGLVLLSVDNGLMDPHWWAANVKMSQMISMVEVHKSNLMNEFWREQSE